MLHGGVRCGKRDAETLKPTRKGTTVEDNIRAVQISHEALAGRGQSDVWVPVGKPSRV